MKLAREESINRRCNLPYKDNFQRFFSKGEITNWKRGVIKSLWLSPTEREIVRSNFISNPEISSLNEENLELFHKMVEYLQVADIKIDNGSHKVELDTEMEKVLENVDREDITQLEDRLKERETVEEILKIIRNKEYVEKKYDEILEHLSPSLSSQEFVDLILNQYEDEERVRIESINILLSILNTSQNEMSVEVERESGVTFSGLKDSIVALISRYGPFSKLENSNSDEAMKYIQTLAEKIAELFNERAITYKDLKEKKEKFCKRFYNERRESTFGHQSFDPLEIKVETLLENYEEIEGFEKRCETFPNAFWEYLNERTAYTRLQFKIDTKEGPILVKTVAGKSGSSSKRKEMSGRIRIMKFAYDNEKEEFKKRENVRATIIVLDGEWTDDYVDLLYESGWDYVCNFNKFKDVLNEIILEE